MLSEGLTASLHIPAQAATPVEWEWERLDKVCDEVFDCPHSTPKYSTVGPYIARSQDIRSGIFRKEEAARVPDDTYQERVRRAEPRYGDLLYSREGTYFGIAAEVPPDTRVCLGQRMVLLRPNPARANTRYLRYWLNSPVMERYIAGFRDGTVAERLNLPTIRELPVLLPPVGDQERIALILGALDDKIELNRRMNETLEAIARAIFKSWFVDFDPVRANMEGQPAGMDAVMAKPFPGSFDDTSPGEVPDGWASGTLGDVAILSRAVINPANFPDETFEHFSIPAFDEGQTPSPDAGSEIKSNKWLLPRDSILVSKLNPRIPRVWLPFVNSGRRAVASTEFLVLSAKPPTTREFLYCLCWSKRFIESLAERVTGTSGSHQRVRPDDALHINVVIPPSPVLAGFTKKVTPLLALVQANRSQSLTLTAVRDLLLPKLLSGEIKVREAKATLGAAS